MHNARHLSRRAAIADGQLDGVIVPRCLVHRMGGVSPPHPRLPTATSFRLQTRPLPPPAAGSPLSSG